MPIFKVIASSFKEPVNMYRRSLFQTKVLSWVSSLYTNASFH